MEKGLIPSNLEILAFVLFLVIAFAGGWQVMTVQNGAIAQLTKYCDDKYGINNYTLENGHSCIDKEDLASMFIGMHDCITCVKKVG